MPPYRVNVEAGTGFGENRRRGNAICNSRVVEPAVTESAEYRFGRFIRPGMNSISVEAFVAPIRFAEAIFAASSKPGAEMYWLLVELMRL